MAESNAGQRKRIKKTLFVAKNATEGAAGRRFD
jgi:hypothetical protein